MAALEGRVELAHKIDGLRILGADDDAIGAHEVLHRRAFLQELRVGNGTELGFQSARHQFFLYRGAHPVRRADRDGGFAHDDLVAVHVAADGASRRNHVLQVCRTILVRRRAHRNEL